MSKFSLSEMCGLCEMMYLSVILPYWSWKLGSRKVCQIMALFWVFPLMVSGHHVGQQLASAFTFLKKMHFVYGKLWSCQWALIRGYRCPEMCSLCQTWFIAVKFSRRICRWFFFFGLHGHSTIYLPFDFLCLFLICPWMQV